MCYLLSKFLQKRPSDCKGFFAEGNTRVRVNLCNYRCFLSKVTYVCSVTLVSVCGKTCADRVSGLFLMPENYPFNPAAPQKLKGFSRNDGRPPSTPVFTVLRAGASDVEAPAQLINFILCYHAVSKCYCGVPAFTTMLPCTCRHRQLTPPRPDERPSGTSLTVHNALRGRKPASSEERGTLRDSLSNLGLSRRLWGNMPCGTLKILALNPSMRTMTRNMVLLLGVKKSRAFARGPLPAEARFSGRMLVLRRVSCVFRNKKRVPFAGVAASGLPLASVQTGLLKRKIAAAADLVKLPPQRTALRQRNHIEQTDILRAALPLSPRFAIHAAGLCRRTLFSRKPQCFPAEFLSRTLDAAARRDIP